MLQEKKQIFHFFSKKVMLIGTVKNFLSAGVSRLKQVPLKPSSGTRSAYPVRLPGFKPEEVFSRSRLASYRTNNACELCAQRTLLSAKPSTSKI